MDFNTLVVCGLLLAAVILFVTELLAIDTVALLVMVGLMVSGVLTPGEGLAGFSHEATVTIAAMFVLSEGVRRTGTLNALADLFVRCSRQSYWRAIILVMPLIGVISAFINNTAAVAIFIPVMLRVADESEISPSRLLMPLSFAAMFGGVCTLIGTSTNILVSSLAEDHGLEPFGMFEFTPLGLIMFAVGVLYLLTVGHRLVPQRRQQSGLSQSFELQGYLTDIVLEPGFEFLGEPVRKMIDEWDLDLDVILVFRENRSFQVDQEDEPLQEGDVLRLHGGAEQIQKLLERKHVAIKPVQDWEDGDWYGEEYILVEVVVAPDSVLAGRTLDEIHFLSRFNAQLLAVRRRGELQRERLNQFRLAGGDSLLLAVGSEHLEDLQASRSFVVVSEVATQTFRRRCVPVALGVLAGVVGAAAFDLLPIVVAVVAGVAVMLLTRCLKPQEAYEAIHWRVIFLLAGIIPLGRALEKTGIAEFLAHSVIDLTSAYGGVALVSGFFLIAMLLTEIISNQATAALLAPVVINAAAMQGLDPRPLLMAVTFAASLSFMTPVGYQTNTLIYGPGRYRFTDFTRVGAPLNLIFWLIGTLLIPVFWPLN